jgi:methylmalonyl-CoA/ethylmalonyl-CoA epimerase
MSVSPKKISHIGIAVYDLNQSMKWIKDILGMQFEGIEMVESEKVRVAFFRIGESRFELLEPTSSDSTIAKFLKKYGEGIHHIALEVENLPERLRSLQEKGIRLIHEQPKRGAHDMNIAFLHPKDTGGVLLELCEPNRSQEKE